MITHRTMRLALALLLALVPSLARAQSEPNPARHNPPGAVGMPRQLQRSQIVTVYDGAGNPGRDATTTRFNPAAGGGTGMLSLEMPGPSSQMQLGLVNDDGAAWGVTMVTAIPSASYGSSPIIGANAYDSSGQLLKFGFPFEWGDGTIGDIDSSRHGQATVEDPASYITGGPLCGATTTCATLASGGSTMVLSAVPATANVDTAGKLQVYMYLADPIGCIPRVTAVGGTGGVSSTTLTVTAISTGGNNIKPALALSGGPLAKTSGGYAPPVLLAGTNAGTGTGGTGTYTLAAAQTIPDGTVLYFDDYITSVTNGGRTFGLAVPTIASCAVNTSIWASIQPFHLSWAATAPSSPYVAQQKIFWSKILDLTSSPRTDGGFTVGDLVTCASCAAGTVLSDVLPKLDPSGPAASVFDQPKLILSQGLSSSLAALQPIKLSRQPTMNAGYDLTMALGGQIDLPVSDTTGIFPGMAVDCATTCPSIFPAGTVVRQLHKRDFDGKTVVMISGLTTANLLNGTVLSFSRTVWNQAAQASNDGTTPATGILVGSTTPYPVVTLRYTTPTQSTLEMNLNCYVNAVANATPCDGWLGLPPRFSSVGPASNDGTQNYPGLTGSTSGVTNFGNHPVFVERYNTMHPGLTLVMCGGYQAGGGNGTVSADANALRRAAELVKRQYPLLPVGVVNMTSQPANTDVNLANCRSTLKQLGKGNVSLVVLPPFTNHPVYSLSTYVSEVNATAAAARAVGAQVILLFVPPEVQAQTGVFQVAQTVSGATSFQTIASCFNQSATIDILLKDITTPGNIPANTTGRCGNGSFVWTITAGGPVSVQAGDLIQMVFQANGSGGGSLAVTGNLTSGSPSLTLTGAPSSGSLVIGAPVSGTGIPASTTISALASGTANTSGAVYTLSKNATATNSSVSVSGVMPFVMAQKWPFTIAPGVIDVCGSSNSGLQSAINTALAANTPFLGTPAIAVNSFVVNLASAQTWSNLDELTFCVPMSGASTTGEIPYSINGFYHTPHTFAERVVNVTDIVGEAQFQAFFAGKQYMNYNGYGNDHLNGVVAAQIAQFIFDGLGTPRLALRPPGRRGVPVRRVGCACRPARRSARSRPPMRRAA